MVGTLVLDPLVPRSTDKTCIRREYVCTPNLLDLVYSYKSLQKYLLDPKDLLLNDALAYLRRNQVSNIAPNHIKSSLMGKIQDQSVSTYTSNWHLASRAF